MQLPLCFNHNYRAEGEPGQIGLFTLLPMIAILLLINTVDLRILYSTALKKVLNQNKFYSFELSNDEYKEEGYFSPALHYTLSGKYNDASKVFKIWTLLFTEPKKWQKWRFRGKMKKGKRFFFWKLHKKKWGKKALKCIINSFFSNDRNTQYIFLCRLIK